MFMYNKNDTLLMFGSFWNFLNLYVQTFKVSLTFNGVKFNNLKLLGSKYALIIAKITSRLFYYKTIRTAFIRKSKILFD